MKWSPHYLDTILDEASESLSPLRLALQSDRAAALLRRALYHRIGKRHLAPLEITLSSEVMTLKRMPDKIARRLP
jgi:hypothetical protein